MTTMLSESASHLFTAEFKQLSALVQKRIEVEWDYHQRSKDTGIGLPELLVYADKFGQMLKVVYRYSLLKAFQEEANWYATTFSARGSGHLLFAALLESWIVAIEGVIKPPECNELAAPLQQLHQELPEIIAQNADSIRELNAGPVSPLVACLLRGDISGARDIVSGLVDQGRSLDRLIIDLILPAMAEVGLRWELHTVEIYQEHLATEAVRSLLVWIAEMKQDVQPSPPTALISCVPGDEHDLVPLALWAYLEVRGWSARNLGKSLPADQIARAVADLDPDTLFLVQTLLSQLDDALKTIDLVHTLCGDCQIVVGGRGAEAAREILENANAIVVNNFDEACRISERKG
ncbi:MAG: cobalamin B12-binding domain-containing protein [Gammaproteobacteria bacterium]|nr:MAG: cobalamin B12-binding domain-containing protein [Gammaproteobacteria bacterium]